MPKATWVRGIYVSTSGPKRRLPSPLSRRKSYCFIVTTPPPSPVIVIGSDTTKLSSENNVASPSCAWKKWDTDKEIWIRIGENYWSPDTGTEFWQSSNFQTKRPAQRQVLQDERTWQIHCRAQKFLDQGSDHCLRLHNSTLAASFLRFRIWPCLHLHRRTNFMDEGSIHCLHHSIDSHVFQD